MAPRLLFFAAAVACASAFAPVPSPVRSMRPVSRTPVVAQQPLVQAPQQPALVMEAGGMDNFKTYLSIAPVMLTVWMTFTAGFLIESQRFNPDALFIGSY